RSTRRAGRNDRTESVHHDGLATCRARWMPAPTTKGQQASWWGCNGTNPAFSPFRPVDRTLRVGRTVPADLGWTCAARTSLSDREGRRDVPRTSHVIASEACTVCMVAHQHSDVRDTAVARLLARDQLDLSLP